MLLLMGTGMMFGWAKPVPVNTRNLRVPRRDMMLVAAAGPAANMTIALVAALLFHLVPYLPDSIGEWAGTTLWYTIWFNVILAIFNMLPLPPLDGGKVAVGLLPYRQAMKLESLERFGYMTVIGLFMILPRLLENAGIDFPIGSWLIFYPANIMAELLFYITGHGL